MAETGQRRAALVIALAVTLATRLAWFWLIPLCAEDAYIGFHASLDPAWHQAATSPVWALLCGLGDPPTMARVLSLCGDLAVICAACAVMSGWGLAAFVLAWCGLPFFIGSAVSGLETHLAACALLVASIWPGGYFLSAALRPDAALMSLCLSGRRWRWALGGALTLAAVGWLYSGHPLPTTMASKLHVYGWRAVTYFWWYAVAPCALLVFHACRRIQSSTGLFAATLCVIFLWPKQNDTLHSRVIQERELWRTGSRMTGFHPTGTVLLEPAGMIPYQNRQLRVIDEVGLVTPEMAKHRSEPGWRTDAIAKYRPEWVVVRMREYVEPDKWMVGSAPAYRNRAEAHLPGYVARYAPGVRILGEGRASISMQSSNLVVFQRRP